QLASGQFESIAFLNDYVLMLSPIGIVDLQSLVCSLIGIAAHVVVRHLNIKGVVLNHLLKAPSYILPLTFFAVNRFIDLELANLCLHQTWHDGCSKQYYGDDCK